MLHFLEPDYNNDEGNGTACDSDGIEHISTPSPHSIVRKWKTNSSNNLKENYLQALGSLTIKKESTNINIALTINMLLSFLNCVKEWFSCSSRVMLFS